MAHFKDRARYFKNAFSNIKGRPGKTETLYDHLRSTICLFINKDIVKWRISESHFVRSPVINVHLRQLNRSMQITKSSIYVGNVAPKYDKSVWIKERKRNTIWSVIKPCDIPSISSWYDSCKVYNLTNHIFYLSTDYRIWFVVKFVDELWLSINGVAHWMAGYVTRQGVTNMLTRRGYLSRCFCSIAWYAYSSSRPLRLALA